MPLPARTWGLRRTEVKPHFLVFDEERALGFVERVFATCFSCAVRKDTHNQFILTPSRVNASISEARNFIVEMALSFKGDGGNENMGKF